MECLQTFIFSVHVHSSVVYSMLMCPRHSDAAVISYRRHTMCRTKTPFAFLSGNGKATTYVCISIPFYLLLFYIVRRLLVNSPIDDGSPLTTSLNVFFPTLRSTYESLHQTLAARPLTHSLTHTRQFEHRTPKSKSKHPRTCIFKSILDTDSV